jgi:hypothetical protein
MGVALTAHLWVHKLSDQNSPLDGSGKPKHWDELKQVFAGAVEMDQVTFLSTGWENVSGESGDQEEQRIWEALRKDVEQGLAFEALWNQDGNEAWSAVERVIASSSEGERKRRRNKGKETRKILKEERKHEEDERKRREEQKRKAEHERRVNNLQREIDDLYADLNNTEDGRELRRKLARSDKDLRKYLLPIATQLDNPNIEPAKRKELQKKMKEEYTLSWREFRGHFAEVRTMHIDIGPNLRSFYGLPPPVSRPCSN